MSSRGGWVVDRPYVLAPPNAGSNDPARVVGLTPMDADYPAVLTTFYAVESLTVLSVDLARADANSMFYDALVTGAGVWAWCHGVIASGVVSEAYRDQYFGRVWRSRPTDGLDEFWDNAAAIGGDAPMTPVYGGAGNFGSTSDSAAIGTTETVAASFTCKFMDGLTYRLSWGSRFSNSAGTVACRVRLRKTNAAGIMYHDFGSYGPNNTAFETAANGECLLRRAGGAGDLTTTVVITMQASAGTTTWKGSITAPRWVCMEACPNFVSGGVTVT